MVREQTKIKDIKRVLEAISKIRCWFKVKADSSFNPQEYLKYFEDLKREPSQRLGQKIFLRSLIIVSACMAAILIGLIAGATALAHTIR
jgi:exoribonuclease R